MPKRNFLADLFMQSAYENGNRLYHSSAALCVSAFECVAHTSESDTCHTVRIPRVTGEEGFSRQN